MLMLIKHWICPYFLVCGMELVGGYYEIVPKTSGTRRLLAWQSKQIILAVLCFPKFHDLAMHVRVCTRGFIRYGMELVGSYYEIKSWFVSLSKQCI